MEQTSHQYQVNFSQEKRNLFLQRSIIFHWLGIIFFPLFSILDYFIVREHFQLFLVYRILFALILVLFFYLLTKNTSDTTSRFITFSSYLLGGLTITMMVLKTGGYSSSYYVGLLLIAVGAFSILPLSFKQAAFAGVSLYLVYAIPVFLFARPDTENVKIFFSNSFFFLSIIVVSLVQCNEETKARIRKFNLNMKLKSLNKDLSFYTHNLENEVDKRMKNIEESKLRYKELYENILDLIVLIDRQTLIQVANQHFYSAVKKKQQDIQGKPLIDIVHPDSRLTVSEGMFPALFQEGSVKDFQFILQAGPKNKLEMECNARQIAKKDAHGYQLVIRDISARKTLERKLLESYTMIENSRTTAILALAKLAEFRDKDTGNHLERIREYAKILATEMAKHVPYKGYITHEYIEDIYLSSILHDIGKVGIPDTILLKPGKLTDTEFEAMKCHTVYGGDTLMESEKMIEMQSFLSLGKQIAYYHHEKWDGSGYPSGLKGDDIPLSARIVALADVYDALTSLRCYKSAYSHDMAKKIIVEESNKQFDPKVIEAFLATEKYFKKTRTNLIS
ncbi:MAG: HD domain-containing protein [Desulfobulbaceae bacterium]|nr:HD domain-containing protein [Desulfobulbaceae bacterium]